MKSARVLWAWAAVTMAGCWYQVAYAPATPMSCAVVADCPGDQACVRGMCSCEDGRHVGVDCSVCRPEFTGDGCTQCAAGFHEGGDGFCMAMGTCSPGFKDDGAGQCIAPDGTCASAFHDDGTGQCVGKGTCASGYHDGGDGSCLAEGTCAAGYHDGGDGRCIPSGTCTTDFRDDGTGRCVEKNAPCAAGYHNGGGNECVPAGVCVAGYRLVSGGSCVAGEGSSCAEPAPAATGEYSLIAAAGLIDPVSAPPGSTRRGQS